MGFSIILMQLLQTWQWQMSTTDVNKCQQHHSFKCKPQKKKKLLTSFIKMNEEHPQSIPSCSLSELSRETEHNSHDATHSEIIRVRVCLFHYYSNTFESFGYWIRKKHLKDRNNPATDAKFTKTLVLQRRLKPLQSKAKHLRVEKSHSEGFILKYSSQMFSSMFEPLENSA